MDKAKLKKELLDGVTEDIKNLESVKKHKTELYEDEVADYDEQIERLKTLEKAYKTIK